jgi:hypothetical protein
MVLCVISCCYSREIKGGTMGLTYSLDGNKKFTQNYCQETSYKAVTWNTEMEMGG